MIGKAKVGAVASLLAVAAAAGCATAPERYASGGEYYNPSYPDADRIFRNGYVDATRPLTAAHAAYAVDARTLAAYEGIEGARLAHQVYAEGQAEKLDGACERYVKIIQGETLYDIASLCDVPVYMLMDYNPSIDSPRHVFDGQTIEVPYVLNGDRLAYAQEAGLINAAATYIVQPGDTLSSIASSHLAPAYSIADLNPEVDWRALPIGATILIPAEPAVYVGPSTPRAKPISSYLGDGDFTGDAYRRGRRGHSYEIEKLMPYKLKPLGAEEATANGFGGMLAVDKSIVSPGQRVRVSATGLPANSNVTIATGPNRAELRTVETVRTGPGGELDASVLVRRRGADMGGVVITATVDRTGETLYSERVGVLKIDDGEEADEELDEALED